MLKELRNDDSGRIWVDRPLFTDSDWPIHLMVKLMYTEYYDPEWAKQNGKYHLEIHAVSRKAVESREGGAEELEAMKQCQGIQDMDLNDEQFHVEMMEYGLGAIIWQKSGNNQRKLLRDAKEELKKIRMLFGFYMDRPLNAIGSTGWDCIRGDILRPLGIKN